MAAAALLGSARGRGGEERLSALGRDGMWSFGRDSRRGSEYPSMSSPLARDWTGLFSFSARLSEYCTRMSPVNVTYIQTARIRYIQSRIS